MIFKKSESAPTRSAALLELVATGAVTCIGNSAPQTLASFVSHARRTRRIRIEGHADPFTIADCQTVTDELRGADRLAALLESSVYEALESLTGAQDGEWLDILVLPRWLDAEGTAEMQARFGNWCALHADGVGLRSQIVLQAGADGAWKALAEAYRWLDANPNARHVLIAAVDSGCEPDVLARSAAAEWLLYPGRDEGYIPGEAGACVVLRRAAKVGDLAADRFALHRPALTDAGKALWPTESEPGFRPLAQAIASAMDHARMRPMHISHLQSDMDGSAWRARLESNALGQRFFSETDERPQIRLADVLGQVGAATGLIGWIIASLAQARQVQMINTVLAWSVDREGGIAANVLERSPQ